MTTDLFDVSAPARRRALMARRRPWLLIVASLLLAVLCAVLWAKWADSRIRAERLQAEIKTVYAEAEALRTQAARSQQRVLELERELREISRAQMAVSPPKPASSRPAANTDSANGKRGAKALAGKSPAADPTARRTR
jgi:type VI protein secretion system component VasK